MGNLLTEHVISFWKESGKVCGEYLETLFEVVRRHPWKVSGKNFGKHFVNAFEHILEKHLESFQEEFWENSLVESKSLLCRIRDDSWTDFWKKNRMTVGRIHKTSAEKLAILALMEGICYLC